MIPSRQFSSPPLAMGDGDAVRLLNACADAFARWFSSAKQCVMRERSRLNLYREDNSLPKRHPLPYVPQPPSAAESAMASSAEATIRALFGPAPADYARDGFLRAVETGDMRAFKIRLAVLKARDALKGSPLYHDFSKGVQDCISLAESLAGCRPDPSPRRLSRAERERRDERRRRMSLQMEFSFSDSDGGIPSSGGLPPSGIQQGMGAVEGGVCSATGTLPCGADGDVHDAREGDAFRVIRPGVNQDIEHHSGFDANAGRHGHGEYGIHCVGSDAGPTSHRIHDAKSGRITPENGFGPPEDGPGKGLSIANYSKASLFCKTAKYNKSKNKSEPHLHRHADVYHGLSRITENPDSRPGEGLRSFRESMSVEEMCSAVRSGEMLLTEAFEMASVLDDAEVEDCDDIGWDDRDDCGDEDGASPFSYNPEGFGGCYGGQYSDSGMCWDTDG